MGKSYKKGKMLFSLNSIEQHDETIAIAKFIIHDFEKSLNGQIVTKEIAEANMHTLKGKPVACRYIPQDDNMGMDALTDHEMFIDVDRDTGEEMLGTKTIPIGFFSDVYIETLEVNGVQKEVLVGEANLWIDKNPNIIKLLYEWMDRNIPIPSSVEYAYRNYEVIDGIEYVQSPIIYLAHIILNAEDRGDYEKVTPAYTSSKIISLTSEWDRAVAQQISTNNKLKKASNQTSLADKYIEILKAIQRSFTAYEYKYMRIHEEGIYDDYVLITIESEDGYNEWSMMKYPFIVLEDNSVMLMKDKGVAVEPGYVAQESVTEGGNGDMADLEKKITEEEVSEEQVVVNEETEEETEVVENEEPKEKPEEKDTPKEKPEEKEEPKEEPKEDEEKEDEEEEKGVCENCGKVRLLSEDGTPCPKCGHKKVIENALPEEEPAEEEEKEEKGSENAEIDIEAMKAELAELKEAKAELDKIKFEEQFNALLSETKATLKGINALNLLEEEDTINLIKKAVNDDNAKLELQQLIINAIPKVSENEKISETEGKAFNNKKVNGLEMQTPKSFFERYGK